MKIYRVKGLVTNARYGADALKKKTSRTFFGAPFKRVISFKGHTFLASSHVTSVFEQILKISYNHCAFYKVDIAMFSSI